MEKDTQLIVFEKDIKLLVKQLKKKEIDFFDIPEELRTHPTIVKAERKLEIRKSDKRGYDVIHNTFFVEEIILTEDSLDEHISTCFADFASYYKFLEGDIYENACYYQYRFSQAEIDTYNIDSSRINYIALIDFTVKDRSSELLEKYLQKYEEMEKEKALRKQWIARFNSCNTYEDFLSVLIDFNKSNFLEEDLLFFCTVLYLQIKISLSILLCNIYLRKDGHMGIERYVL